MRKIEQEFEKYQLGAAPNDLILKEVKKNIYQINGFRILDIRNINIGNRELNEQYDDLKLDLDLNEDEGIDFNSYLFPPLSKLHLTDLTNAKNRLMNSQIRFIDEIFWFWPQHQNYPQIEDEAIDANSIEVAETIWNNRVLMESESMTSIHNLAVLHHAKALDHELSGNKNNQQYWQKSMSNWRILFDNRKFWDLVKKRAQELEDPQLREEIVHSMISTLPIAILLIQKDFIITATENNDTTEIQKHIKIIKNSKFAINIINEALERTADTIRTKNEEICQSTANTIKNYPENTITALKDFIKKVESLFYTLDQLLAHRPEVLEAEHDRAALTIFNSTVEYVMKSTDPTEQIRRQKETTFLMQKTNEWTSNENIKREIKIALNMTKSLEIRDKLDKLLEETQNKTNRNPSEGLKAARELLSKGKTLLNELNPMMNGFLNELPNTDPLKSDIKRGIDIANDDVAVIASNCIFACLNTIDPQNRALRISMAKEALPLLKDAKNVVKTDSKRQELQKQIDQMETIINGGSVTQGTKTGETPPPPPDPKGKKCIAAILGIFMGVGIGFYLGGWWWALLIILPIVFTSLVGDGKK